MEKDSPTKKLCKRQLACNQEGVMEIQDQARQNFGGLILSYGFKSKQIFISA
jgi:hypothetical protein